MSTCADLTFSLRLRLVMDFYLRNASQRSLTELHLKARPSSHVPGSTMPRVARPAALRAVAQAMAAPVSARGVLAAAAPAGRPVAEVAVRGFSKPLFEEKVRAKSSMARMPVENDGYAFEPFTQVCPMTDLGNPLRAATCVPACLRACVDFAARTERTCLPDTCPI